MAMVNSTKIIPTGFPCRKAKAIKLRLTAFNKSSMPNKIPMAFLREMTVKVPMPKRMAETIK
jgi:hypothetical protein